MINAPNYIMGELIAKAMPKDTVFFGTREMWKLVAERDDLPPKQWREKYNDKIAIEIKNAQEELSKKVREQEGKIAAAKQKFASKINIQR